MSALRRTLAVALALIASGVVPFGSTASPGAIQAASGYLATAFDPASSANAAAETLIALSAAASSDPVIDKAKGVIREKGPTEARSEAAYAGRIAMGLGALGEDPRAFGGADYLAAIATAFDPHTGSYDPNNRIYANALAGLGLSSAGERLPDKSKSFLRANECPGGGFGHDAGCPTGADVDTTSMVGSLLLSQDVRRDDPVIERIRIFLKVAQRPDGGFGLTPAYPTNANSTGLALSFIAALNEDPSTWTSAEGADPRAALAELQNGDGGFRYRADMPRSNYYATVQALTGLVGMAYPPQPRPLVPEGVSPGGTPPRPESVGRSRASGAVRTPLQPDAAVTPGAPSPAQVSQMVVVELPTGEARTSCVYTEPHANGIQTLVATGMPVTTRDYGGSLGSAVCTIDGVGNSPGDCPGGNGHWHYWVRANGRWVESETGASNTAASTAPVQAWTWSDRGAADRPPDIEDGAPCTPSTSVAGSTRSTHGDLLSVRAELAALMLAISLLGLIAKRANEAPR